MDQVHMGGPWSGNYVLYTFPKVLFAVAVIRNRQNTTPKLCDYERTFSTGYVEL